MAIRHIIKAVAGQAGIAPAEGTDVLPANSWDDFSPQSTKEESEETRFDRLHCRASPTVRPRNTFGT